MRQREAGSTLLTVMAAVLILTTLMTALVATSARDMTDSGQYIGSTAALANARSGMQAVYQAMSNAWNPMVPSGGFANIQDAENALTSLPAQVQNMTTWNGAPFTINVSLGTNNFQQVAQSLGTSVSTLWEDYNISVGSTVNGVTRELKDVFTISGTIDALNYAVYTPGNLFITGSPEIDGNMTAGGSVFVDPTPWEGVVQNYRSPSSYLTYEGSPLVFYPEPKGFEANVLAKFGDGAAIAAGNGLYSFSGFSDQQNVRDEGTYLYGDGDNNSQYITGIQKITTTPGGGNDLSKYVSGGKIVPNEQTLPSDYVSNIVSSEQSSLSQLSPVYVQYDGQYYLPSILPATGGKINAGGRTYTVTRSQNGTTVSGATYIDGGLTVASGANLNLTQPLFVNGNLVVNGILTSSAAIYVSGSVTITNVPPDQTGQNPSRLELFSDGNILLTLESSSTSQEATEPTTFHSFLASNSTIYLEGMDSFYHIIGGVAGKNIILNATVGKQQSVVPYDYAIYIQAQDLTDLTRRLWITYDDSYVTNPLTGTPTLNNLILQPMPQPTIRVGD